MIPIEANVIAQPDADNVPVKHARRKPDRLNYANMCADVIGEHISLAEAINGSEKEQWQSAMKEELKSFSVNKTCDTSEQAKFCDSSKKQVGLQK